MEKTARTCRPGCNQCLAADELVDALGLHNDAAALALTHAPREGGSKHGG